MQELTAGSESSTAVRICSSYCTMQQQLRATAVPAPLSSITLSTVAIFRDLTPVQIHFSSYNFLILPTRMGPTLRSRHRKMAMTKLFPAMLALQFICCVHGFQVQILKGVCAGSFGPLVCNRHTKISIPVLNNPSRPSFRKCVRDDSKAPMSMSISNSAAVQDNWNQFVSQCSGSWNSLWSTYNWIGDMEDETIATVELLKSGDTITHNHIIPLSSTTSSCERCQDSFETRTIPVAQYSPGNLRRCGSPERKSSAEPSFPIRLR